VIPPEVEPHFRKALKTAADKAAALARQEVLAEIGAAFVRQVMGGGGGVGDGVFSKAFSEGDHPRDDHGRFVSKGELSRAKGDPAKAAELRARVTDPEQRKKLDAAIGEDGDAPAPAKPAPAADRAARAERAREAVAAALADPKALKPHHLRTLREHLSHLSKEELKGHARALREKVGGNKADLADRLRERVKAERVKKEGTRVSTAKVDTLPADADASAYEVVGTAGSKEAVLGMNMGDDVVAVQKRGGKWVALRARGEGAKGEPAAVADVPAEPEPSPVDPPAPVPAAAAEPKAPSAPAKTTGTATGPKATLPAGHEAAGEHDGGAVVGKDRHGNFTTHFPPGAGAAVLADDAKRNALADAVDEAHRFTGAGGGGLAELPQIVAQARKKGLTPTETMAALSELSDKRVVSFSALNEMRDLTKPNPDTKDVVSMDRTNPARATLWKGGLALHFLHNLGGNDRTKPGDQLIREYRPGRSETSVTTPSPTRPDPGAAPATPRQPVAKPPAPAADAPKAAPEQPEPAKAGPKAATATARPDVPADAATDPDKHAGAGRAVLASPEVRQAVVDAADHLSQFVEFQTELYPLPRFYREVAKRVPGLTVPQFQAAMWQLSKDRAIQLHVNNSNDGAGEKARGGSINTNGRLYDFVRLNTTNPDDLTPKAEPATAGQSPDEALATAAERRKRAAPAPAADGPAQSPTTGVDKPTTGGNTTGVGSQSAAPNPGGGTMQATELKPLVGSEKQVAWAGQIRDRAMADAPPAVRAELAGVDQAKAWIDHKDAGWPAVLGHARGMTAPGGVRVVPASELRAAKDEAERERKAAVAAIASEYGLGREEAEWADRAAGAFLQQQVREQPPAGRPVANPPQPAAWTPEGRRAAFLAKVVQMAGMIGDRASEGERAFAAKAAADLKGGAA
jgi:hypothetical protein